MEENNIITVLDIYEFINTIAPYETQAGFDNSGILVGDINGPVISAMLALDVTGDVIRQAQEAGCQLIISHHPVMINPIRRLPADSIEYRLANAGIALISAHTNLDVAKGGVNYCLASQLGLLGLETVDGADFGIMAWLPTPMSPRDLAELVRDRLGCGSVGYVEGLDDEIERVAIICGSGGASIKQMIDIGAQAVITGEAKHNEQREAQERGNTLVMAGHFPTENVVVEPLCARLREQFPGVSFVMAEQTAPMKYL
ncbi:MAG: Nif3-like dinuclear metal center hexameric protein [Oscillospiraceae bacterium]|nr:Nif3-like dinuclear metal center hexameric protein [Oscillospiraceae bacterium]